MNFVSYNNAETILTEIGNKIKALNGAYIFKGSSAFASLPEELTSTMVGYVYNVSDNFTTDARFIEGAGKKYSAGTNVAVAEIDNEGTKTYLFDVIGNFIDVDELERKIKAVQDMITGEFDESEDYAVGDVVVYDGDLYKCTTAHTVGEWNVDDFTATTVAELIAEAEPDELTETQVNTLLALLD